MHCYINGILLRFRENKKDSEIARKYRWKDLRLGCVFDALPLIDVNNVNCLMGPCIYSLIGIEGLMEANDFDLLERLKAMFINSAE